MPAFSVVYPVCLLLIAFLATGWLIAYRYPVVDDDKTRDIQVDGLRGLLGFGVMTSHYLFIVKPLIYSSEVTGGTPNITSLLGAWSVPMFFGITAYLFSCRLISSSNHQGRSITKFLLGRAYRLIPTSLLACLMFLLMNIKVYTDTFNTKLLLHNWNGLLNAALSSMLHPANGPDSELLLPWAWKVACGAQWTLNFEWMFYFTLASLSVLSFKKQSVLLPALLIILMEFGIEGAHGFFLDWAIMTWAFIPGLLLGFTSKYWKNNRYLSHPVTAVIAITAVLASVFYDKLKLKIPANTLFLAAVLSSNRATRILESKFLRSLGETTYSIYLLHGLIQYATLKWIVTIPIARSLPQWLWWITCAIQVVVIVLIARLSFEYVEKPGIEAGKRFYAWLMTMIERRAKWLLNWI